MTILPQHEDDPQLRLLENIDRFLVHMIGTLDYSEWDRDSDIEMFYWLERIQGGWQQGRGVQDLPRFEPAERQERIEGILSEAVRVMRELFGIYERPVELNRDLMRHGCPLGVWHHDRIWLDDLREDLVFRRALLADEHEDVMDTLRQFLAVAALLIRRIWANEWLVTESHTNRRRVQMLEEAQASWEGLGPPFPQFAAHDQPRVDEILERLVAGMRERYPRDDELAEDNAERLEDASDSGEEASQDTGEDDGGEEALETQDEA